MSYINGSDLLLKIGEAAVGHCTTHTLTFNSETKERAVKPAASEGKQSGLWKGKGITALSISISAEGLRFYEETESGFEEISALWGKGQSVDVEALRARGRRDALPEGQVRHRFDRGDQPGAGRCHLHRKPRERRRAHEISG